jgi:hypothetical protein
MDVIAKAASDPNTDVDKLERLMGLYERMTDRNAEQSFNAAMSEAQAELRPIAADAANPQTKSRYASYAALDRAVRPIYVRNGFSLSFDTTDSANTDHIRVICYVAHRDGHKRTYTVDMPADGKGAKGGDVMTKTHAAGAAMSYGTRYLLKMIFNLAIGEDLDGNAPQDPRDMPAAVVAAMSAINACEGKEALLKWNADHRTVILSLPKDQQRPIIALYQQRLKANGGV